VARWDNNTRPQERQHHGRPPVRHHRFGCMTLAETLTIIALLLSPLIALQVSDWLADLKDGKQRRFKVYRTLMASRARRLAPDHVEALNLIDVEFHGTDKKSKAVLNAWKAYLDHLNTDREPNTAVWDSKRDDLFVDLLYEMSRHVGYDFDKTHIRRTSYFPIGHGDVEIDQYIIRKAVRGILEGKLSFPINVTGLPPAAPDAPPGPPPLPPAPE